MMLMEKKNDWRHLSKTNTHPKALASNYSSKFARQQMCLFVYWFISNNRKLTRFICLKNSVSPEWGSPWGSPVCVIQSDVFTDVTAPPPVSWHPIRTQEGGADWQTRKCTNRTTEFSAAPASTPAELEEVRWKNEFLRPGIFSMLTTISFEIVVVFLSFVTLVL